MYTSIMNTKPFAVCVWFHTHTMCLSSVSFSVALCFRMTYIYQQNKIVRIISSWNNPEPAFVLSVLAFADDTIYCLLTSYFWLLTCCLHIKCSETAWGVELEVKTSKPLAASLLQGCQYSSLQSDLIISCAHTGYLKVASLRVKQTG